MVARTFLGPAARALRKSYGIGRVDMSSALDCSPRWVSRIESGAAQPSPELAARYARRIGVALDVLLAPSETEQAA